MYNFPLVDVSTVLIVLASDVCSLTFKFVGQVQEGEKKSNNLRSYVYEDKILKIPIIIENKFILVISLLFTLW